MVFHGQRLFTIIMNIYNESNTSVDSKIRSVRFHGHKLFNIKKKSAFPDLSMFCK